MFSTIGTETMGRPHVLVIPYPAQGHVMPHMEVSRRLLAHGLKITFVNTEFNHSRILSSMSTSNEREDMINLVSIPDGFGPEDDRSDVAKLDESMGKVMPGHFEDLIRRINESNNISFVIADYVLPWALNIAKKMRIRTAAFWTGSAGLLAFTLHTPKLIDDGIIDANGILLKNQIVKLSPTMPEVKPADFVWLSMRGDPSLTKCTFNKVLESNKSLKIADYLICNSFFELEPSAFELIPNLLPIGPLYERSPLANFWPENSSCMTWLNQQRPGSVVYVAFGSFTILDKQQFCELALGLELCRQPFLWVVRPDLTDGSDVYPDRFEARIASRGQMVSWAPQRDVLAHPSVGCFLTHCGWNSTMEGLSQGVPFLCWPYFADQFLDRSYICDVWKVGLGLEKDDQSGLIPKQEIAEKVVKLLGDLEIKTSSLKWKEMALKSVRKGGSSLKNFEILVQAIKS